MYDLFVNNKLNISLLKEEKWLQYLYLANRGSTNVERVTRISDITGHETLNYVLETLKYLKNDGTKMLDASTKEYSFSDFEREFILFVIRETLKWSEVSKGGSLVQQKTWFDKGYPLDIHNLASADIFLEETNLNKLYSHIIYTLIMTHGIIGQNIRGEVSFDKNYPLHALLMDGTINNPNILIAIINILNMCILRGVSNSLYESLKDEISEYAICIVNWSHDKDNVTLTRYKCLKPNASKQFLDNISADDLKILNEILLHYDLWYFEPAFSVLSDKMTIKVLSAILHNHKTAQNITNITFKPLITNLYYDYEGKKKVNIYKLRIIEKLLNSEEDICSPSNEHIHLSLEVKNNILLVDFVFTAVCSKLIDFCVEAERSGILTYENSITLLFDTFGFRKDEFDRLNNEEKYLNTMNDTENSTKNSIIDYVVASSVVDVGSGGGVLLDLLETTYPDMNVTGTDISSNVIDFLNTKKVNEHHNWNVLIHNFVNDTLKTPTDNIIFSSILHEVYSYTEYEGRRFNIDSVKCALRNAYSSLNPGGRIIIRDGIKTDSTKKVDISFTNAKDISFFKEYLQGFMGLNEISRDDIVVQDGLITNIDINYAREFLFTYTWGAESFSHEINEQFGYFTKAEWKDFIENDLKGKIVKLDEFLEEGYTLHLDGLVSLVEDGKKVGLPESNCIVVIEKI